MTGFDSKGLLADQHFDVLIIGAGISGIGAARQLQRDFPEKSFAIVEKMESFGGTWLMHKYPGVRSDSDLYTFGYKSKPWVGAPIATGSEIMSYLDESIDEAKLEEKIHYQYEVQTAEWCSHKKLWCLSILDVRKNTVVVLTTQFLWMCQGYYDHKKGYTPNYPGAENYSGQLIHPQNWPKDLDYKNKKVVLIGSGATAATIVPNIADDCQSLTMLQRSPTYFWSGPNRNELADTLRELDTPEEWVHQIVRSSLLKQAKDVQELSISNPDLIKQELINDLKQYIGDDFDYEKHLSPKYRPWQQRLAYVPDGDLFKSIAAGKTELITDTIECFTEKGVLTSSGRELEADIIISATGFNLKVMGGIDFKVDGEAVNWSEKVTYRGVMMSDIPNLAYVFGYLRTSWTMRVDLICDFVSRLFKTMDRKGAVVVTPRLRECDKEMELSPWISNKEFNPGYLQRSIDQFPKQGSHAPWLYNTDYYTEKDELPNVDFEDGATVFD